MSRIFKESKDTDERAYTLRRHLSKFNGIEVEKKLLTNIHDLKDWFSQETETERQLIATHIQIYQGSSNDTGITISEPTQGFFEYAVTTRQIQYAGSVVLKGIIIEPNCINSEPALSSQLKIEIPENYNIENLVTFGKKSCFATPLDEFRDRLEVLQSTQGDITYIDEPYASPTYPYGTIRLTLRSTPY